MIVSFGKTTIGVEITKSHKAGVIQVKGRFGEGKTILLNQGSGKERMDNFNNLVNELIILREILNETS
tara:strand:- start:21185 stop:21388 length:204 start_codon:yes stop_codon:yes gene_type:complete